VRMTVETELDRTIDVVWRAYQNPENLQRWMPTLTSFQPVSGTPGQPGAVSRLVFVENGRSIVMDETVVARQEPYQFSARFDTEHGSNIITSSFESLAGGRTKWNLDADFQFKGFLRLISFLFKGMIRKRLNDDCARFKEKLESGALAT
jgi:uncharacterized membrane protein